MFTITVRYNSKGKDADAFTVDPNLFREVSGETMVEALSKFNIEVAQLLQELFERKMSEVQMQRDNIPF